MALALSFWFTLCSGTEQELTSQLEKAKQFRALHDQHNAFVLPTAWDAASARIYQEAGAPAVGTASSGIAHTLGHADGEDNLPSPDLLWMTERIVGAVDVPVTADMEGGHGDPAGAVQGAVSAGAVGVNLEDRRGGQVGVTPGPAAAEAISRARETASALRFPLFINARTDTLDYGGDLQDAVSRANLYLEAGADCVLVIGASEPALIAALVHAVRGPLNIALRPGSPGIPELAELGVRRISVTAAGAVRSYQRALAREILVDHNVRALRDWHPYPPLNQYFQAATAQHTAALGLPPRAIPS